MEITSKHKAIVLVAYTNSCRELGKGNNVVCIKLMHMLKKKNTSSTFQF